LSFFFRSNVNKDSDILEYDAVLYRQFGGFTATTGRVYNDSCPCRWPRGLRRRYAGRSPVEIVGSNPIGDMDVISVVGVVYVVR
jgi:hypothetical protein